MVRQTDEMAFHNEEPEEPQAQDKVGSRRKTLLEQADLDTDSNEDEQLLSSNEYSQRITDEPSEFLRELRELIK